MLAVVLPSGGPLLGRILSVLSNSSLWLGDVIMMSPALLTDALLTLRRDREGQLEDSLKTGNCELLGLSKPNSSGAKLSLLDLLETRGSLGKFDSFLNSFWLS